MRNKKISIIIPCYNPPEDLLNTCMNSLLEQTFMDIEIIIVDDGSEKVTAGQIDELYGGKSSIQVIHTQNNGVSTARNIGLDAATGETICFVDADDYVAPWMLEDLWNVYTKLDEVQAVCAYYKMTNDNNMTFIRNKESYEIKSPAYMKQTALIGMSCNENELGYLSAGPVAVLFEASLAKEIKFNKEIKYMEDVIWNYEFFSKSKNVGVLYENVYAYRINVLSASHQYNLDVIKERIKALNVLKSIVHEDNMMQWFALRTLSNYVNCCKCCMKLEGKRDFFAKLKMMHRIDKNHIWNCFKDRNVSVNWSLKQRIKQVFAVFGVMPIVYYFKHDVR